MVSTLGSGDVAASVERTISRRGADKSTVSFAWTSLALGGVVLALVAMGATWYADVGSATAWYSGWLPPLALLLVIAGGFVLVAKQVGLFGATPRVSSDLFLWGSLSGAAVVIWLYLAIKQNTAFGVTVLAIVSMVLLAVAAQAWRNRDHAQQLELEQVSLALGAYGTVLILVKRLVDSENATSGWVWGLIAAAAVVAAGLAACQYLGILSAFQVALFVALAMSVIILIVLLAQVLTDGWPVLSERLGDFWSGTLRSQSGDERLGISQGLIGSFWIAVFVVLLAFPIGIAAAVYLEEYAPRNWFTGALDIIVRNLAGVPSVVYGLLGLFLFVKSAAIATFFFRIINWLVGGGHWVLEKLSIIDGEFEPVEVTAGQSSLFAGGVTLAILVLPIVIITAAEAVRAVPDSLRQGAYGVGATKWEVIRSQVLPFAAPGILTGTLLALARAVGEAAPLILVGAITGRLAPRDSMFGGFEEFFGQFADRFTAMPIIIVGWVRNSGVDKGFAPAAGAAIVMLLVFVILMNSVAVLLRNHFEKKRA